MCLNMRLSNEPYLYLVHVRSYDSYLLCLIADNLEARAIGWDLGSLSGGNMDACDAGSCWPVDTDDW